jgi:RNA polymerase sigma-70 factor (ECF subfamily)
VSDIPDEQLARRARRGDRKALGVLLERHQKTVFSMACRILNRRADALDAAQEAFLRVCRHIGTYHPGRPFLPWIRRIAVRAALDQARRQSAQAAAGDAVEDLPDGNPGPLEEASRSETATTLRQALAVLTPSQRAAFVCKEVEGMDTKETARVMGCRRATVRWHLFEARKRLAETMASYRGGQR